MRQGRWLNRQLNALKRSPLARRAVQYRDRFPDVVRNWNDEDYMPARKAENAALCVLTVGFLFCLAVWTTVGFNAQHDEQIARTTSVYGTR